MDDYLRRAEAAGLSWPLPAALDDGALERLLFPPAPAVPATARGVHDWSHIHRELKRPGVTLQLLWHEYRQTPPARLSVHLVLPAVPDVARQAGSGHASESSGR